jgi:aminopeptidase N
MRRSLSAVVVAMLVACGPGGAATRGSGPGTAGAASPDAGSERKVLVLDEIVVEAEPPALRLPETVRPIHYGVILTIDPEQETFRGSITIDVDVREPTFLLWLHAVGLEVHEAKVTPAGGKPIAAHTKLTEPWLALGLDAELPAGRATIELTWTGTIDSERSRGLYRVKEPDGKWYAYTFFEPVDARRVFPCFDEPGFKTPWKLVVFTPPGHVVAFNTALASRSDADNGSMHVFESSWPMSTYQVAFMVGPFEIVDGGTAGRAKTPVRFVLPPGHTEELAWARQATPRAVALLEDYFDMPYPFGKLDVAVVPRFWGTMEHPGIVAMGQPLTLIKPDEDSMGRRIAYANILIHELGHYWFGDLVTMAWWDDTWLNEGLTTWLDVKITTAFEPKWRYDLERLRNQGAAMSGDTLVAAKALRQPIRDTTDIQASFDSQTTYSKGASVMFMLEHLVGEDKMQRAVRAYMRAHEHGNATTEQFVAALVAEGGADVGAVLASYVDQPGVPLVKLDVRCDAGAPPTLALAQERFWPDGSRGAGGAAQTWTIPVCVRYGRGAREARHCGLLRETSAEWPLEGAGGCPQWIVGNEGMWGYYRVELAAPWRAALVKRAAKLPVAERWGIVSEMHALVSAGRAPRADAFALVPRLASDPEPMIAARAVGIIGRIEEDHLDDADRPRYRRMVRKLFGATAKKLGWKNAPGDDPHQRGYRAAVLARVAFGGRDPKLLAEAETLARAWLADRKAVDPDMVGLVLGAATLVGGTPLFEAYLAEARRTTNREDRALLLGMLGAFREPALAGAALALVLDTELDIRETSGIVFGVLGNIETRALGWAWIEAHWDEMAARMRDDEITWHLAVAGVFCDAEGRKQAEAFFAPRAAKIDGGARALAKVLERIDLCIVQREKNAADVKAFLRTY